MKILNIFKAKRKTRLLKVEILKFVNAKIIYMSTPKYIMVFKINNNSMQYLKKKNWQLYTLPQYNPYNWVTNFYLCNKNVDYRRLNKIVSLREVIFQKLLVSINSKFKAYMRVRGIGYKFVINKKILIIHVGYSHVNTIILPASMTSKLSRKSSRLKLQNRRLDRLMPFRATVRKFRTTDIFIGKGIRYRYEVYKLKEGKKKKTF